VTGVDVANVAAGAGLPATESSTSSVPAHPPAFLQPEGHAVKQAGPATLLDRGACSPSRTIFVLRQAKEDETGPSAQLGWIPNIASETLPKAFVRMG